MNDALVRLRVCEAHGIRRFLYPLTAYVTWAQDNELYTFPGLPGDREIDLAHLSLVTNEHDPIPSQFTQMGRNLLRIDFAVSLAPHEVRDYLLTPGTPRIVDDPLRLSFGDDDSLRSRQRRFEIACRPDACISEVIYDGIHHVRSPLIIHLAGSEFEIESHDHRTRAPIDSSLAAWTYSTSREDHRDGRSASTKVSLTACKSWATVEYEVREARPDDEVVFTLPFAASANILTYDTGVEGVYGKLDAQAGDVMTWQIEIDEPDVPWTVATNDRIDYAGSMPGTTSLGRRWFHLVDAGKSLAVAITDVPESCCRLIIRLESDGTVQVMFHLDREASGQARFGVCYHFLNDIPAIAAATNPQSILLPPTVEVLSA